MGKKEIQQIPSWDSSLKAALLRSRLSADAKGSRLDWCTNDWHARSLTQTRLRPQEQVSRSENFTALNLDP